MFDETIPIPLEAIALSKSFGSTRALDQLTLSLPEGKITALLGANGAGKTTLIRSALGLQRTDSGMLSILGGKPGALKVRERIGVMLQNSELPDLLTGREMLTQFGSAYPAPLAVEKLIHLCDLSEFADKRYKALSGGQKRRVQFALALIGNPELIFLDEPTTGLDGEARRVLWGTVRELSNSGKTVLLTTHYLEEADALADHIIVMANGRVVAEGPADEIRQQAKGALITCQTTLSESDLLSLPEVLTVQTSGRLHEIRTNSATQTARALLNRDQALSDLTISKPRLEDAFQALTQTDEGSE
ncbi:MAG: ABC transporter ATP-binding protein [Pseudomonadota bacterium]